MYQSILVPYDKSVHAKHALDQALMLARASEGAKVTVLSVVEVPDFSDPTFAKAASLAGLGRAKREDTLEMQRSFYEGQKAELIDDVAEQVEGFDNIVYRATSGKPQDVIAEFADSGQFDLIVMGCRGLGGLRGAIGSVSYAVLRSVDIPVLAVK